MTPAPEVSVVIPTRDRRDVVAGTVRDVLGQHEVELEIVVVCDGAVDGTADALAALGDERVRIVEHSSSLGLARARNAGAAVARAPWIAVLDDDDRWAPDKLRRQLDAATRDGADWVYASAVLVDPSGRVRERLGAPPAEALVRAIRARNVVPAGASNVMVRTALLRRLGGFDPAFAHVADWDMWIRLAEAGRPARCPEALVAYVLHTDNLHLRRIGEIRADVRRLEARHAASPLPGRLDEAAVDAWMAGAHLRAGRHLVAASLFARAAGRSRNRGYLRPMASAVLRAVGLWRPRSDIPRPTWLT